jgi:hypothetical protein
MDIQNICQRIYDVVLSYAEKTNAPVAYINVEAGSDFEYGDNALWEEFNKLRWDTELSSAELSIERKSSGASKSADNTLRVVSIVVFEDGSGDSPDIPVKNGLVYPLSGD